MAGYRFLTTWILDAPIARVWDAIYATERWPEWWRGVESVEKLRHGDEPERVHAAPVAPADVAAHLAPTQRLALGPPGELSRHPVIEAADDRRCRHTTALFRPDREGGEVEATLDRGIGGWLPVHAGIVIVERSEVGEGPEQSCALPPVLDDAADRGGVAPAATYHFDLDVDVPRIGRREEVRGQGDGIGM
jgi:hypothetical protein